MPTLRPELGTLPPRIRLLPIDARGYPVPWFVEWFNGAPDFRIADAQKFARAIRERLCWVCGERLGVHVAFVIGPMCAVNRTSSEPPSHVECAMWSAQNCPFLSRPHMVRREGGLPGEVIVGDASIMRNPAAAGVWVTRSFELFKAPGAAATNYLIEMGMPERVAWFAEGRAATRAEVRASIDSGMPLLDAQCEREANPLRVAEARAALIAARATVERWLPSEEVPV
jgi:hypothetical protein